MAPPRYSPLAETASNVVAVPKSTTIERPAVLLVGGDGGGDPVGADLERVLVEDGHPRLQPRPDDRAFLPKRSSLTVWKTGVRGGTTLEMMTFPIRQTGSPPGGTG